MTKKILKLLTESKLKYEVVKHKKVFTAYDAAATLHVKLNQIAKSLLVKTNKPLESGKKPYAIVIVPADKNVDLKKLAKETEGKVGSDIEFICRKASMLAIREFIDHRLHRTDKDFKISKKHFDEAIKLSLVVME